MTQSPAEKAHPGQHTNASTAAGKPIAAHVAVAVNPGAREDQRQIRAQFGEHGQDRHVINARDTRDLRCRGERVTHLDRPHPRHSSNRSHPRHSKQPDTPTPYKVACHVHAIPKIQSHPRHTRQSFTPTSFQADTGDMQ